MMSSPDNIVSAEDAAYVVYTSGSTGKPKGVLVPHRAVNRLVINTNYIKLHAGHRIAQISNISFDAATFEIWGALLNGATLVGARKNIVLSADRFHSWLNDTGISAMFMTTAAFNHLVSENPAIFSGLEYLLFGGEEADVCKVREVLASAPPRHLINVYGPTENTTFSTWHEIKTLPKKPENIPIGRPVSNTQAYILDRHGNPVPIGVRGELYLGGAGLAMGYLNNEVMSTERFILDPFSISSSARLYSSGDLARFRPDGVIEFLGRVDKQVKIRGFRIEPGEIESVLRQHEAVDDAIVSVMRASHGDKRLLAYVTLKKTAHADKRDLRTFLEHYLPAYMQPAEYVILDKFPLTENGKIDRSALPDPGGSPQPAPYPVSSACTQTEKELLQIWKLLLGREDMGIHDDFFHLGGHSLLAARLFTIIKNRFQVGLPLAVIYEAGTISQLARRIVVPSGRNLTLRSLAAVRATGGKPALFWGMGPQARKFLDDEQPLYVLQHQAQDGYRVRYPRIEDMARWYLQDIRKVQSHGPYFLGGFSFGGMLMYEIARQIEQEGDEVALLFLLDATLPGHRPRTGARLHALSRGGRARIRRGYSVLRRSMLEQARLVACIVYFTVKLPLPVSLRSFYILRVYRREAARYKLQPLKGRIVFFKFDKTTSDHAESNPYVEINQNCELYSMKGRHRDIDSETHAFNWGRLLNNCLSDAQNHF